MMNAFQTIKRCDSEIWALVDLVALLCSVRHNAIAGQGSA